MLVVVIASLLAASSCSAQQPLPALLQSFNIMNTRRNGSRLCPATQVMESARSEASTQIQSVLSNYVVPELNRRSLNRCPCGGPGEWRRIAHLNMSNPSQQCPPNWDLITSPLRSCGQSTTRSGACDSATFSSNGQSYSRVCGRVNAYQRGDPEAFSNIVGLSPGLENPYIDGVSITHGAPGNTSGHL